MGRTGFYFSHKTNRKTVLEEFANFLVFKIRQHESEERGIKLCMKGNST